MLIVSREIILMINRRSATRWHFTIHIFSMILWKECRVLYLMDSSGTWLTQRSTINTIETHRDLLKHLYCILGCQITIFEMTPEEQYHMECLISLFTHRKPATTGFFFWTHGCISICSYLLYVKNATIELIMMTLCGMYNIQCTCIWWWEIC